MKIKKNWITVMKMNALLLFCTALQERILAQTADIILINGKIFTSDTSHLYVQALAIKGNKIMATGSSSQIQKLADGKTRRIDLGGKTVVPGFNDAHDHAGPEFPARRFKLTDDPSQPTPWSTVKDSILKIVTEIPAGTFIITTVNPDLLDDPLVRRKELDRIAPNNPVMLDTWTGHGKILNSAALRFVGFKQGSTFLGGRLEEDAGGLTGLLEEYANYKVGALFSSKLERTDLIKGLRAYYNQAAALGITTIQNMCTEQFAKQVADVYSSEKFPCRVRLIAFPFTNDKELLLNDWSGFFHPLNAMNYVSGVKLILDGTPVERLACTRQAYTDRPGDYGRLNFSEAQLRQYMQYCLAHKQQIIIHAVGDSSIVVIIRAMRLLHPDSFWKDKRLRIEHAELAIAKPEDLMTLQQLGIVIVQNPSHLTIPGIMYARFGRERMVHAEEMHSLIRAKVPLAIGSDGPLNPFLNIMFATMHPDNPGEALSVEEAVIAYTYGSAYAEFRENEKGSLAKGKLADLAVLSQDIFSIPKEQLPSTRCVLTILDGKVVYEERK